MCMEAVNCKSSCAAECSIMSCNRGFNVVKRVLYIKLIKFEIHVGDCDMSDFALQHYVMRYPALMNSVIL